MDYNEFKAELIKNPLQGDLIPGTSGIRKARLKSASKGKSGGFRVCYYYIVGQYIYLLWIYQKNKQENLTEEEKSVLRELAKSIKETRYE